MAKVLGKNMSLRCVVMPDPDIYAEKYMSHHVQRQAAVGNRNVKQVFHTLVFPHQGEESHIVKVSNG